ncbi:MAG: ankyrin repeat domain-containing protein, partial [Spirochaetota bacterium]
MNKGTHSLKAIGAAGLIFLALTFALASCASAPAPVPVTTTTTTLPPPPPDLSAMIGSKDSNAIKQFFANRETLDKADANGLFPLHKAVEKDAPDIIDLLITMGAKVDSLDKKGRSPLRLAIDEGRLLAAKTLALRGAGLFLKDAAGTTIAEAAVAKGPEMLIAVFGGANANARGPDGSTILQAASDKLSEAGVRDLLAAGADPLAKNASGRSALDLALLHPDRVAAARIAESLILRGANPGLSDFSWFAQAVRAADYSSIRFEEGKTPLHKAVDKQQRGIVEFLLSRGANANARDGSGSTPLHEAIRSGWLEGAALLLANKADPNARDGFDNTPLHISMPESNRAAGIDLLLSKGADPSLKDRNGNIPLHVAIQVGYPEGLVQKLISAGSAVNASNSVGDTPLIVAARSGRLEYVPALLAADADIFANNARGESALSIAVNKASIDAPAKAAGATDSTAIAGQDRTSTLGAILVPANIGSRDNQGNTPLAIAIGLKASTEAIAVIVAKGADVNARNNSGDSPLLLAVRQDLRVQGEALLSAKADVFVANAKGDTPISLGLTIRPQPTDWLFNSATIAAKDKNGDSVLHHAARRNLSTSLA